MINHKVPFYSNTPDGTHCFQAVLRMILKYFLPNEEYSFEELDIKTAKVEGLWTWLMAGLLWLKRKGFEIKKIGVFDYQKFAEEGDKYLIDFYGKEVGEVQIAHSKISQEIGYAKTFSSEIEIEKRTPEIKDIKDFLDNGNLVVCVVNSRILNNLPGYSGHFVLITGYDKDFLILNDPGLPGQENRRVSFNEFEKSWAYPDHTAKIAISLKLNSLN